MTEDSKRNIEKWYDLYFKRIFHWAHRIRRWNKHTAEEIASNVVARIIEETHKEGSGSLPDPTSEQGKKQERSLRRIEERKEATWEANPPTESLSERDPPSDEPGPLDALVVDQAFEEAMKAIERLDPKYRSVVLLYDYEDYTHKEIAEKLGIKEDTSRSRLKRGRREARTMLLQKRRK